MLEAHRSEDLTLPENHEPMIQQAIGRSLWLVCIFMLLPICAGLAQSPTSELTLTREQIHQDFDVLRSAIEEAHGGLHRFSTKAQLDAAFETHRARLDRPMSKRVLAGILAETIAELRDGHARLELDSATNAALAQARVLPLRAQIEGDRLVILFNDSPNDTTIHPGMEVLSINGRSAGELIRMLLPKVTGDGFIETGRRVRLARDLPQLLWLYVDQNETYHIVARDSRGRQIATTLHGVREGDRRTITNPVNRRLAEQLDRLEAPPGTVALQFLRDPSIARLRIRSFGGQNFAALLDSAFRLLRERNVNRLVLDLRGNGGGVDEYGALLLSHLLDQPFRYFDHIWLRTIAPSFATWPQRTFAEMRAGTVPDPSGGFRVTTAQHTGVGEQRPAPDPFTGQLIVLIDGGTFSTAADVAAHLRSQRRATFVGEETAGGYEGNTSGLNALIVLPNSKLRLKIMMYDYWNAVRPAEHPGRGIIPDHPITRSVADLLRGIDQPLDAAVERLLST